MKIKTNIVKLLAVLAILGSLVAIAAVPASAVVLAAITLTPSTGPVGQGVTISATDFIPNAILTVKIDGAVLATNPATVTTEKTTDLNPGDATFGITIPTTTAGTHQISVSDGTNTVNANFIVTSKVTITSPTLKKGPVGTSVSVAGTGFSGAGVTADVTIGGASLAPNVTIDNTGSFTATGVVPTLTSGDKAVSASDGDGNSATTSLQTWNTFTVTPTLTLTPSSGLSGAKVTVSGSGWAQGAVSLTFAGTGNPWKDPSGVNYTVNADINGLISAPNIVVPVSATAGTKTVTATDVGAHTGSATFAVIARPLTLTPTSGPRGTQVLITGSSMTPSTISPPNSKVDANDLVFGILGWNKLQAITIDSAGVISPTTLYVLGNATLGVNAVRATDNGADFDGATTTDNLTAEGTFTVTKPIISASPTSGPKGSSVTVTGSGWLPGTITGSTVQITFNGAIVVTTIPDPSGNIVAAINVPATALIGAGANTIGASDGNSNSATSATFTVPGAAITVNPAEGPVGTSVTVTGSGFAAYTAVTVKIGTYPFQTQPLTGVLGDFIYTFTVPGVAPGSQSISVTDLTSTASAFFVVKEAAATTQTQTASISSQLVRIWGYAGGTWSMYDPTDAASDLTTLTSGNGYWISVNADCTLIYGGFHKALSSSNWNLVGWP
ncbi:MAG: hypothetical protein NTV59_07895 [Chloroflexi bacterium]|nr:hypothetical protein [Chloroflexota bacterium]